MLDDYNVDKFADRLRSALPAYFNQGDASVNQAIIDVIVRRFVEMSSKLLAVNQAFELDKADSGTLDLYAADWGVHRIDSNDDYLRMQIRLAKMRHRTGITENDLIKLIAYVLQSDPTEFHLIVDRDQLDGEPEAIKLMNIPDKYNDQRKSKLLIASLQAAVSPEVRIAEVQFSTNVEIKLYVGMTSQQQRKTYSTATILQSRTNNINRRAYVGLLTQQMRSTHPELITTNLKGVEVNG